VKKKHFIAIALTLLLLSFSWTLLTPALFPPAQAENELTAAHPGFLAPGFTLETPQGQTLSLSDYRGQPVLVFLWASWCSVCKATMPGLQAVYMDYQTRGFEILAVNTTSQDTLSAAVNYFSTQDYTYPFLIDGDGSVSRMYQLHALPTSVLVGPDGIVVDVVIGSGLSEGYLRAELDSLLNLKN
jgi:peroxiredoxin